MEPSGPDTGAEIDALPKYEYYIGAEPFQKTILESSHLYHRKLQCLFCGCFGHTKNACPFRKFNER